MLKEDEPELAERLESIGRKLDTWDFSDLMLVVLDKHISGHHRNPTKERHRLVAIWVAVLERVRQLQKFEHFLKPIPFPAKPPPQDKLSSSISARLELGRMHWFLTLIIQLSTHHCPISIAKHLPKCLAQFGVADCQPPLTCPSHILGRYFLIRFKSCWIILSCLGEESGGILLDRLPFFRFTLWDLEEDLLM
jgi:hypothetical protein